MHLPQRAWELSSIRSIDPFDAPHANIRLDIRGNEIKRVLPRV